MNNILTFFFILFSFSIVSQASAAEVPKEVDSEWIKQAMVANPEDYPKLLDEFFKKHPIQTPKIAAAFKEPPESSFVEIKFVALDQDPEKEALLYVGSASFWDGFFYVLDKTPQGKWAILYQEQVEAKYGFYFDRILSSSSTDLSFCISDEIRGGGSGGYQTNYKVFKILDHQVVPVLEFVKEAGEFMSVSWLNGKLEVFDMRETAGQLSLKLRYELLMEEEKAEEVKAKTSVNGVNLPFFKGQATLRYDWNPSEKKFNHSPKSDLTEKQLEALVYFNEVDFFNTFQKEIAQIESSGKKFQKIVIQELRERVEK